MASNFKEKVIDAIFSKTFLAGLADPKINPVAKKMLTPEEEGGWLPKPKAKKKNLQSQIKSLEK